MNGGSRFLLACCLVAITPGGAWAQLPKGTWRVNGNGQEGVLEITSFEHFGKIEGMIFDEVIRGTYDVKTRCLSFVRLRAGAPFQAWKGYLSQIQGPENSHKSLAGTFVHLEASGPSDAGWFAIEDDTIPRKRIEARAVEDAKKLQGRWEIQRIVRSVGLKSSLPAELGQEGNKVTVEGDHLLCDGKVVATFDNALPNSPLHGEIGPGSLLRLIVLTLPDGKTIPCSYRISDQGLEITCPHTYYFRRGAGQIVVLKRPEATPPAASASK